MNLHFVYVVDKSDQRSIWTSVVNDDEYRIGTLLPEDVVVDIGMHTGSFCARAFIAGSRRIYGFEADEDNCRLALANVGGMAQIHHIAVTRSDARKTDPVFYSGHIPMEHELNTGVGNVFAPSGTPVETLDFDDILGQLGPTRLVKMDCEGSEWPILYTASRLLNVAEFVGEWHLTMRPGFAQEMGLPPCDLNTLRAHMEKEGFLCRFYARTEDMPSPIVGNFRFVRERKASRDGFARDLDGRQIVCGSAF